MLVVAAAAWVLLPAGSEEAEEAEGPEAEGPRLGRGGVSEARALVSALSMALLLLPELGLVVAAAVLGTPSSPEADAAALLEAMDLSLLRRREAGLAVEEGDVAVWSGGGKEWARSDEVIDGWMQGSK